MINTMMNCLRHPIREHFLARAVLGFDLLLWLLWLPIMLRIHSVPTLLERLARGEKRVRKMPIELIEAIGIVTRICNLMPFRARIFPQRCLRQSLALYRTLSQMGYSVEIHFGVLKDSKNFHGHSWVTMQGEPVADTARSEVFRMVYSYPILRETGRVTQNKPVFNEA